MGTCIDRAMKRQDEIFLCLVSTRAITDVLSLSLQQNDMVMTPIEDGIQDDYTWVVKDSATNCTIRTRLNEAFVKPSFRGRKRTSLTVHGVVMLENDITDFEMELPLQSFRLLSYLSGRGKIVLFFVTIGLVICVWAGIVAMATAARNARPPSLTPDDHVAMEEKRMLDIYTIWYQSQQDALEICQTDSMNSGETFRSHSTEEEEEKEEIEAYNDEESVSPVDPALASNAA